MKQVYGLGLRKIKNILKNKILKTLDEKIDNLKKSESIIISSGNGITCSVERSSNGKNVRFVRTFENGSFEVFRTSRFNQ